MALVTNSTVGTGGQGLCGAPSGCVGGIPTIISLDPPFIEEDSGDFTLTITGSNLNYVTQAVFNGIEVNITGFMGSPAITQITVLVPGALIANAGTFNVYVNAPDPGCGPSSPFPFIVTPPPPVEATAGLRFMINEDYAYDPEATFPAFRVQEAGSRSVYRMLLDDQGLQSFSLVCVGGRFSPDATKLAAIWYLADDDTNLVRVYDLGESLTAGTTLGDDIFELDAPVINEVESDLISTAGLKWIDVVPDNDGNVKILQTTEDADVIQDPIWFVGRRPLDVGTVEIIVYFDPRGTLTSTRTFQVDTVATTPSFTLTATPGEAWWDASPNPASSVAGTDQFAFGQHASFDITIDATALADGEYEDTSADKIVTTLPTPISAKARILPDEEDSIVVELFTNVEQIRPLGSLKVVKRVPTLQTWSIVSKTLAGSPTVAAESPLITEVFEEMGNGSPTLGSIVDGSESIISLTNYDQNPGFFNLSTDHLIFISPDIAQFPLYAASGDTGGGGARTFNENDSGGYAMACKGIESGGGPVIPHLFVMRRTNDELFLQTVTDDIDDLLPEEQTDEYFSDIGAHLMPHMVFTGEQTGFSVGAFLDLSVRRIVADGDDLTVEAPPGVLNISPGEADPDRVRELDFETGTGGLGNEIPTFIMSVGYGGIEPEEI